MKYNGIQRLFNLFPQFKGKFRLARLFFNKNKSRDFKTPKGLCFSVPNLHETVSFELFVNGIYEKETIEFICKSIPQNGVFVDVGANIGAICIEVAKLRKDVTIYAFEASPRVFSFLQQNKSRNNVENLFIYNLAIHEQGDIELPFYSPIMANGKGSFSPVFTDASELVKTIRLDSFITDNNIVPDFIKVDVEGYELLVFRSLSNYAKLNKLVLLFEFVDWAENLANQEIGAAQNYLLQEGFLLTSLSSSKRIFKPIGKGMDMIVAKNF
jgi:FkbM family methyltransferase